MKTKPGSSQSQWEETDNIWERTNLRWAFGQRGGGIWGMKTNKEVVEMNKEPNIEALSKVGLYAWCIQQME